MPQKFKTVEMTLSNGKKIQFKNFGYINFGDGIKKVDQLQRKQKKQIEKMYSDLAEKVDKEINRISFSDDITISDSLKKAQLKDLQKEINKNLKEISGKVEKATKINMLAAAVAATAAHTEWLNSHGINIKTSFASVPQDVIANIISGKLYGEKWTFSKRIWADYNKSTGDVAQIVAKGIAGNRSTYDIAKDLEKYVDPKAKKPWDWSKVYPNSKKQIDYNAQRLARTMITHAYEQSTVETSKVNPFVVGIEWRSAFAHNTCEICMNLDGQIFKPDELPLDHPNGQCDFLPVIGESDADIEKKINDWVYGKADPETEAMMEQFAEYAGFGKKDVKINQRRR